VRITREKLPGQIAGVPGKEQPGFLFPQLN
jgi:hypothetical protein